MAGWRIIDGAKPYRFTRIGKDRRSENGSRRDDRKALRARPIVPNRHAFNSFWDAADAQLQIVEAIDMRPNRGRRG